MNKKMIFILLTIMLSLTTFQNASAKTYDLYVGKTFVNITGSPAEATAINGTIPGKLLRFKEGEEVVINVKNNLDVDTSIHWHGLIVPWQMDGVPGISFDGIPPGETFTYKFKIEQNGTYWYHSHSGFQEQTGMYAPIIIDPIKEDPVKYDREHIIMLSDWKDENPDEVYKNLKSDSEYYTTNRRTAVGFLSDWLHAKSGDESDKVVNERSAFAKMRMSPEDIVDVSGYTFLINGKTTAENWNADFKAGERVRLRFINAAASTYFDVSIPGLKMEVVQADGQNLQPVMVDRFNIAIAETYDVIVTPEKDIKYEIFAQAMDRTGFVSGTLGKMQDSLASSEEMLPRRILKLKDVMSGMKNGMKKDIKASASPHRHNHNKSNGKKVLSYADLHSLEKTSFNAVADREITLRLTGVMDRYIWSFNDKKFDMSEPLLFNFGERVRVNFVNETMMDHPIHLHGLWQELQNGSGDYAPRKHTVNVPPKQTVTVEIPVDNGGKWAFHCHILFHAAAGMFQQVNVEGEEK